MRLGGVDMFYVFMTGCSVLLMLNARFIGRTNTKTASP